VAAPCHTPAATLTFAVTTTFPRLLIAMLSALAATIIAAFPARADLRAGMERPLTLASLPDSRNTVGDLAALADGTYLLFFSRQPESLSPLSDLFVQRLSQIGLPLGAPIAIDSLDRGQQWPSGIAATEAGDALAVFMSSDDVDGTPGIGSDGTAAGVFARSIDAAGNAAPAEVQINTSAGDWETPRSVVYLGGGSFVISWSSYASGVISWRRFDRFAQPIGAEMTLVPTHANPMHGGYLASNGAGLYAIAWAQGTEMFRRFHVRVFDAEDTPVRDMVVEPGVVPEPQHVRDLGMDADGNVVLHLAGINGDTDYSIVLRGDGSSTSEPIAAGWNVPAVSASGLWMRAADQPDGEDLEIFVRGLDGSETTSRAGLTDSLAPRIVLASDAVMNELGSITAVYSYATNLQLGHIEPPVRGEMFFRRFCQSSDLDCDPCPEGDADADQDAIADACDPCNTGSGTESAAHGRVYVSNSATPDAYIRRTNRIDASLHLALPSSAPDFDALPLFAHGMRIRLQSSRGAALLDAWLPGGDFDRVTQRGWTRKAGTFRYRDRSAERIRGIGSVVVQDLSPREPGAVRITVRGRAGFYGVAERYLPLRAVVVFGNQDDAADGSCRELAYETEECVAAAGWDNVGNLTCDRARSE